MCTSNPCSKTVCTMHHMLLILYTGDFKLTRHNVMYISLTVNMVPYSEANISINLKKVARNAHANTNYKA